MRQILIIFLVSLLYSCNSSAQLNKGKTGECVQGVYWLDVNSEKVDPDSVAITVYVKVIRKEIYPPDYFAAIDFNDQRVRLDKDGKVRVVLPKGEYSLRAFSGGSYPYAMDAYRFLGGGGYTVTFYLKGQIYVD